MRGLGGLILILLALVVGLMWAVLFGPLRDSPLLRPLTKSSTQVTPATATEVAPSKARTAPIPRKKSEPDARAATAVSGLEQLPTATAPVSPPPPLKFPTAVELPLGMRGSEIVASFGLPVARTISVDQDGQIEILIYRRSRPDAATFVHLRNGRVVSAVTMAY